MPDVNKILIENLYGERDLLTLIMIISMSGLIVTGFMCWHSVNWGHAFRPE